MLELTGHVCLFFSTVMVVVLVAVFFLFLPNMAVVLSLGQKKYYEDIINVHVVLLKHHFWAKNLYVKLLC